MNPIHINNDLNMFPYQLHYYYITQFKLVHYYEGLVNVTKMSEKRNLDMDKSHAMCQKGARNKSLNPHCSLDPHTKSIIKIRIEGLVNSVAFQKARMIAQKLFRHLSFKFAKPRITEMFQMDWYEYLPKLRRVIGGKTWKLSRPVAVFVNDEFIGSDIEFLSCVSEHYVLNFPIGSEYYESLIKEHCSFLVQSSKRKYVYFTFTEEGSLVGSFLFMLYSDLLPLTCQHFLNLCTSDTEVNEETANPYYVNTRVHRIVKNGWIQCGGPEVCGCVELPKTIPDESYCVPHDRRGVLSFANDGKHSNKSQFVVSLKPNPWMNCYYVAFGQLVDGAKTLKTIEDTPAYYENPLKQILISQCGEYSFEEEPKMETESKIFLEHESQSTGEGEGVGFDDPAYKRYFVTPWLDNIADKIDPRDTASLLMAERYLSGFYCLSTDYVPGIDMNIREEVRLLPTEKNRGVNEISIIHELMSFQPNAISEQEKLYFAREISKIILTHALNLESDECHFKHISRDTHAILGNILKIARKIATLMIANAEKKSVISETCADYEINNLFKMENGPAMKIPDTCLRILHEILNEAILQVINSDNTE